jgi:hypothetical protein
MMKLAVLQRIIRAGEKNPNRDEEPAHADVWKIARTVGGDRLEYDPEEFMRRLLDNLELRLHEHDKEIHSRWNKNKVKRVERLYTPDEVVGAFKKAWNDVTREIKRETIKIV